MQYSQKKVLSSASKQVVAPLQSKMSWQKSWTLCDFWIFHIFVVPPDNDGTYSAAYHGQDEGLLLFALARCRHARGSDEQLG